MRVVSGSGSQQERAGKWSGRAENHLKCMFFSDSDIINKLK